MRHLKLHAMIHQILLRIPPQKSSSGSNKARTYMAFEDWKNNNLVGLIQRWKSDRAKAFANLKTTRRGQSDTHRVLKAVKLAQLGQMSRALQRLGNETLPDTSDPAVAQQLCDKHPNRKESVLGTAAEYLGEHGVVPLEFNMEETIKSLDDNVAAGPDGMRNEYLKALLLKWNDEDAKTAMQQTQRHAELLAAGPMPQPYYWFLRASKMFAVPKDAYIGKNAHDGVGAPDVRPLGATGVYGRTVLTAVMRAKSADFGTVMWPHQTGVGIRNGASILTMALQLLMEKPQGTRRHDPRITGRTCSVCDRIQC